jgi:hypothetical protein
MSDQVATEAESQEANRTEVLLRPLFTLARDKDEFEYACSLMRLSTARVPGWDPLVESSRFIDELMSVAQMPLESDARLRLGLVVYCHIIEMEAPYHMIANMARVATGERYSTHPFEVGPKALKKPSRHARLERIRELLCETEHVVIADHIREFTSGAIRNAFAHSQYVLNEGQFHICAGRGLTIGNTISHRCSIEEEVLPRINGALAFWQGFYNFWIRSRLAYRANKLVQGRIAPDGGYEGIELIGDPEHGLRGFRGLGAGS